MATTSFVVRLSGETVNELKELFDLYDEDETGTINVIVRRSLSEHQRQAVLGATLLGVYGIWQNEQDVRHLLAERLVDLSAMLGKLAPRSRDFQ